MDDIEHSEKPKKIKSRLMAPPLLLTCSSVLDIPDLYPCCPPFTQITSFEYCLFLLPFFNHCSAFDGTPIGPIQIAARGRLGSPLRRSFEYSTYYSCVVPFFGQWLLGSIYTDTDWTISLSGLSFLNRLHKSATETKLHR